jgi:hypothetical protein
MRRVIRMAMECPIAREDDLMTRKLILTIIAIFVCIVPLYGQVPEIGLLPDSSTVGRGSDFMVELQLLSNIYSLKSYSVEITFDPDLIRTRPANVTEGGLLGSVGAPTFFWVGFSPDSGTMYIDGAILGDGITTGNVGVLALIGFEADHWNYGETPIEFISIRARDANNSPLDFEGVDSWARVCEYLLADANGDGSINVSDAVFIINYIFVSGSAPYPLLVADANCDDLVNVSDAVYIINYIFVDGDPPCRICY